jgi:hypothetical protein
MLITFEGETPDGTLIRIVWDMATPEVDNLFTLIPGQDATWFRPLECQHVEQ